MENIKKFLDRDKMSNTQLGNLLGVSEQTVSRWISGTRNPRKEMIEKMCVIFNCSPNDLMSTREDTDLYIEVLRLIESLSTNELMVLKEFINKMR